MQLIQAMITDAKDDTQEKEMDSRNDTEDSLFQNIQGIGRNADSETYNDVINGVLVCVLYAALPPDAQMIAFQPKPRGCNRKVILATNIAETSITVEGIKFVVDAGKYKMREFSGVTGMESLILADVSKGQVCIHVENNVVKTMHWLISILSFFVVHAASINTARQLRGRDVQVELHQDIVFGYTQKNLLTILMRQPFQKSYE
jgi:hypothetical protein